MFIKLLAALAVSAIAIPASAATTFEVRSGTDQRALTIASFQPLGQSFTATDTNLLSFGFRIQVLNANQPNTNLSLAIRSGTGNSGALIASSTLTPTGVPTDRTASWVDFALTGATLVSGQTYTALITSGNPRYALSYGPDINIYSQAPQGVDAYAGGSLFAPTYVASDPTCNTGRCDASFRFTADTPASAVPEASTWALLVAGFGGIGGALRRRRTTVSFA